MANIKSQIKRIKTNQKATERNRAYKSELRTVVRAARAAIAAGVNAVMGAGTADPVTAGAAGLLVPIGAAIVKGMEKSKE